MGILRTNTVSGIETPTPVTGSVLFDGNGDYLSLASSGDFAWETGDFTIECWINFNSLPTTNAISPIIQNDVVGISDIDKWWFGVNNVSGTQRLSFGRHSTSTRAYVDWSLNTNIWYYVAVVRQSGTIKLFIGGVSQTVTNSTVFNNVVFSQNGISVGAISTPYYFNGYISNLRVLKGTALYTSNFTPPVNELEVIGDTVLLCCKNSSSAAVEATGKTITVNGNAVASTVSPGLTRDFTYGTQFNGVTKFDTQGYFIPPSGTTAQRYVNDIVTSGLVLNLDVGNLNSYPGSGTTWTDLSGNGNTGTLTNGPTYSGANRGSIVFDGSNDYVENTSPNLGITGDASVSLSCWFYFTGTSSAGSYVSLLSYGNGPTALDTFALAISDVYRLSFSFNGGNNAISNQNVIAANTWNNFVGTKTPGAINTTTKLYLNGSEISIASAPTGAPNVTSRVIRVGRWTNEGAGYYYTGRIPQVSIYNRALTPEEVSQNYNALRGRYGI